MNHLAIEGTRSLLMQSGLSERWWPLAIARRVCCYNAFLFSSKDGLTLWERRFGQKADYTVYPVGAMVLFKPAGPGIKLVDDHASSGKKQAKKWKSRLVPALLVGTALSPGCEWSRSYLIVPLACMLSDSRATRASVRRVHDLVFAETISFPMKQRLNL